MSKAVFSILMAFFGGWMAGHLAKAGDWEWAAVNAAASLWFLFFAAVHFIEQRRDAR